MYFTHKSSKKVTQIKLAMKVYCESVMDPQTNIDPFEVKSKGTVYSPDQLIVHAWPYRARRKIRVQKYVFRTISYT